MIDSKDISVVVQGAIDKENTPKCLTSIRKYLPDAEVILSTWEGANVDGLDYDKVILNKDPGAFPMSQFELNNVKRQIFSTITGIRKSSRPYILKIRSDIKLINTNFLAYFDKFNSYNSDWHFLKKRIIIPSLITRDPRIWESPMCPSDWCSFGLREDMHDLWDIEYPTYEEEHWFETHLKTAKVKSYYRSLNARFNPEQFIWVGFVKKHKKDLHCNDMFDVNEDSVKETLLSFANNLIILSEKQFGIKFKKKGRKGSDKWHIITYNDFLKIYNKYSNGKEKVSLLDIQRLFLLKHLKISYKRLFSIAYKNNQVGDFLNKEIHYLNPQLHKLLYPIIKYIKYIEKLQKPDLIIKENPKNKAVFSIVIPVHDNINYFKQTLNSLKNQKFKDFEIIVSDDSSKSTNRNIIKQETISLHEKIGINIKYIYTKKNLGQSRNTNQGLKYVNSQWVRILHSDDLLHKECLQKEYELILKHKDTIAIFHNIQPFTDVSDIDLNKNNYNEKYVEHNADFIIEEALHSHCAVPSALLFKAALLSSIDSFNWSLLRACDWDFWSRIVLYALRNKKTLIHAQDELVFYRLHKQSNTNKVTTKLINYGEYKAIANNVKSILTKLNFESKKIYTYYDRAFAYRKRRLICDYKELPVIFKVIYFKKFFTYLIDV